MTPKIFMSFLKSMGMDGSSWGGDVGKDELISKIKNFQRSSEEQKQAWWTYCDSQGDGNRDPARHDTDFLQAFLTKHGIKGLQGDSFVKSELINKIKAFQRS